jgi:signal transduction histidine kinase
MVSLRPSSGRRHRVTPVMVLLLLTLGLTAVLAYQAVDAAASHRKTTEATLDDYAMFAAWEFSRLARGELEYYLWDFAKTLQYFQPQDATAFPTPEQLHQAWSKLPRCTECAGTHVQSYFALDLDADRLVPVGQPVDQAVWGWIQDTLRLHATTFYEKKWGLAFVLGRPDSIVTSVGYYLRRDAWDQPTRIAYGFVVKPSLLSKAFTRPWGQKPLLPPALTGVSANESLLGLRVADAAGRELFRGGRDFPEFYAGSDTFGLQHGGLVTTVTLNPDLAAQLVIGGLPRSRMPLLLGLLGLTAGLVIVALRQLRRESELARLRADFVSGVSHELRTPLAQIRMFAETLLLERVRSDHERQRALDIVNRESQRLTHLVDNVLQFSRAERGTMRIAPQATRVDRILRDVADCFLPLAGARSARLRLEADLAVTAPLDPGAARQVVLNLLDNAMKYGPPGQMIGLRLTLERGDAVIAVEDQGPGIPTEHRDRVWEPYWRLPRDSASAVGGSGIGLAVVKELVTAHGGSVAVLAGAAGGARFEVRFPGAFAPAPPAPSAPAAPSGSPMPTPASP